MAISKTTVPRQASRTGTTSTSGRVVYRSPVSVEDDRFEEVEELAPVEAEPTPPQPPRLTVNGLPVKRLQIDFGSNATAFYPGGSVMERFWDQHDNGPDEDKYSRPRAFSLARIEIDISKGFMDLLVHWTEPPSITRLVQPSAHLSYEPK